MSRSYRRRADNVYARLYKKHLLGGAKRSSRSGGSLHETTTTLLVGSCFVGEPIGKGRARRRRQTGGPCVQRSQLGASTAASTCAQRCADPTAAQVSAPIASPPSEPRRRRAPAMSARAPGAAAATPVLDPTGLAQPRSGSRPLGVGSGRGCPVARERRNNVETKRDLNSSVAGESSSPDTVYVSNR
jgi:hypothetical protein